MKAFLTLLAASTVALCAATQEATAHVPVLLWSQRATFDKPSAYSSAVLDETKVSAKLEALLQKHDAEAVALFLAPTLDAQALSQLGASSFVESAVKTAASSLVIPHTTRDVSLEKALKEAAVPTVEVADVDAFVASEEGKTLLSNKQTELLVVKVPALSPQDTDAWLQHAAETLSKAAGDKVDFALTGNQGTSERTRRLAASPANITCETGYHIGVDSQGKQFCFAHYVRMTPNLLSGIVIGFFFVFLGYIGFSAMHGIQTPARYPHHGPPKGKEF